MHIVHGRAEVYDILTEPNGMLYSITRVLQRLCNNSRINTSTVDQIWQFH